VWSSSRVDATTAAVHDDDDAPISVDSKGPDSKRVIDKPDTLIGVIDSRMEPTAAEDTSRSRSPPSSKPAPLAAPRNDSYAMSDTAVRKSAGVSEHKADVGILDDGAPLSPIKHIDQVDNAVVSGVNRDAAELDLEPTPASTDGRSSPWNDRQFEVWDDGKMLFCGTGADVVDWSKTLSEVAASRVKIRPISSASSIN